MSDARTSTTFDVTHRHIGIYESDHGNPFWEVLLLRLAGFTNIAAANRHHARDSNRPLNLFGLT